MASEQANTKEDSEHVKEVKGSITMFFAGNEIDANGVLTINYCKFLNDAEADSFMDSSINTDVMKMGHCLRFTITVTPNSPIAIPSKVQDGNFIGALWKDTPG